MINEKKLKAALKVDVINFNINYNTGNVVKKQ